MCAPTPLADPLPYLQGLYQFLPAQRLDFVLHQTGRHSRRRRRLPAPAVSWLVIAMALFPTLPVPQVWRRLHPSTDDPETGPVVYPGAPFKMSRTPWAIRRPVSSVGQT